MKVLTQNRNCLFRICHHTVIGRVSVIYKIPFLRNIYYIWRSSAPNPQTVKRINSRLKQNMTKHDHY